MEQATISIRTDAVLKRDFERLCQDIGMNMTTAFNVIMKQSVREKRIPVTLKADPAYREVLTAEELDRRIANVAAGHYVEKTLEELRAMEDG